MTVTRQIQGCAEIVQYRPCRVQQVLQKIRWRLCPQKTCLAALPCEFVKTILVGLIQDSSFGLL